MTLHHLPTRTSGAAENMAIDFLLLQRYPESTRPRFRHYEWHRPAITFGYAQKIAAVRATVGSLVAEPDSVELARRPTGGGIVDHRDDWTYALVLPRGHPWEEQRAATSYRAIHEVLARTLAAQGVPAALQACIEEEEVSSAAAGVCFQRAEIHDVIHVASGSKIAGAAQKRNKHGLLCQGSVARTIAGGPAIDWARLEFDFVSGLAAAAGGTAVPTAWPELDEDEMSGLTEHYASAEWLEHR